jgi:SAM-dependent methyltransferase
VAESLSFERIADRYDETRGGEERGRHAAGILDGVLDLGPLTLEVGVGTGLVADGLAELGHRVVGVDLSPRMAARAVGRIGPRVAVADARRMPFRDSSFDQAYSVWVLHLVGDIAAVLSEVGRVLWPGGRYVVVPAYGQYADPYDPVGHLFQEMWDALDPDGIRRDDQPRLRDLAPAAGLRIEDTFRGPDLARRESPAILIRNIEQRVFSFLWDVDDERWRRHVEPVLGELRQLPDPDVPIDRPMPFNVVVLQRA